MSTINDIAQQVIDVINTSNRSIDQIDAFSKRVNELLMILQQSMQGTSEHEYETVVLQFNSAKKTLSNAVSALSTANTAGRIWVSSHVRIYSETSDDTYILHNNLSDLESDNSGFFTPAFFRPDFENSSGTYQKLYSLLDKKVDYKTLNKFEKEFSESEIINRLGGGDETEGSCSSLALAYSGNKAGYDILDFRGGNSLEFFSRKDNILSIASLPGVKSKIEYGKDDLICAQNLRDCMEHGKEYYLATGNHAAIVKLEQGKYYYLELQSANDNGWKQLTDATFVDRFRCAINDNEYPSFLIDINSLADSDEFLDILGYINTSDGEQQKGDSGYEK